MESTNFQPIFDYIDGVKEEILAKQASKEDIQKLQQSIDSFAKDNKQYGEDFKLVENKASRLEAWALKAAKKTEIPYGV
jgi:hypothetical protein